MARALTLCLLLSAFCLLIPAGASAAPPPIKHVFVIVLENKDYADTFGPASKAPYLSKTLVGQGQLLPQYHGIGHESLDNYIAMVSGQSPNPQTQADCQFFTEFQPGTIGADGQALGQGCVYPATVKTIADQLDAKGLTWKGYMEDMKTPCRHPAIGAPDDTQSASATNQYAARHNPFVYFHSIIDRPACAQRDVPLEQLTTDLQSEGTTPNFSFITPDLCHDGHDTPCKGINEPGGLVSSDQFLRTWVPRILDSPAYQAGGMLIVTFDESESGAEDCCNEPSGPNTPNNGGPEPGNGGGRTGTVLLSQFVKPGVANDTPYNHYSLLRSIEDIFGLDHLGYAARPDLKAFGDDVYNQTSAVGPPVIGPPTIRIAGVPRKRCARRSFKARIRVAAVNLRRVNVMIDRRSVARKKTKRLTVRIRTRKLHGRHHRFTVRVSQGGASGRKTVRFRTCA
jgi:phosphatidylinositol-3-phosphatase